MISPPHHLSKFVSRTKKIRAAMRAGLILHDARIAAGDDPRDQKVGRLRICVVGRSLFPQFIPLPEIQRVMVRLDQMGGGSIELPPELLAELVSAIEAFERQNFGQRVVYADLKGQIFRLRVSGLPARYDLCDQDVSALARYLAPSEAADVDARAEDPCKPSRAPMMET